MTLIRLMPFGFHVERAGVPFSLSVANLPHCLASSIRAVEYFLGRLLTVPELRMLRKRNVLPIA